MLRKTAARKEKQDYARGYEPGWLVSSSYKSDDDRHRIAEREAAIQRKIEALELDLETLRLELKATRRLAAPEGILKKKGRPPDKYILYRRETIRSVAEKGLTGEAYCQALNDRNLKTPVRWQTNEKCPKFYPDAYNHPDPVERKKWRQRIANEKHQSTRKNSQQASNGE
jgi:hypothetical protein